MITFDLFAPIIINCFAIIMIWKVFSEGMILEGPGSWIQEKLGEYWSKPILSCPPCMTSVWGTLFYFIYVSNDLSLFLPYILAVGGLNYIVMNKIT